MSKFAFSPNELRKKVQWHMDRAGSIGSRSTAEQHAKHANDIDYVNEHREATGHRKFGKLSTDQVQKHLEAINKHAPYGDDPWGTHKTLGAPDYD